MSREKVIIKTSIIGIIANVFLAGFKAVIGLISNSVAIVLDAVNNLSDALSSIITIIGTKLAGKAPDKKHPLGYGRVEYLSTMIISVIILYAGVTSFVESVKKIITPEKPDYSSVSLIIIAVAVVVKIVLGLYVKGKGKSVNSESLIASGTDALFDSIISFSTLVAAFIYLFFNISLEAWLGAIISVVIIKSGFEMLKDTVSLVLGERTQASFSKEVKKTICSFDEVSGAYDLIIHNYGPQKQIASVHIEIPDTMSAEQLDLLERKITKKVYTEHDVYMTGISVYAMNTKNDENKEIMQNISNTVLSFEKVIQIHGFYINKEEKTIRFDIIIDYDAKNIHEKYEEIKEKVQKLYPDYNIEITLDYDITE